MCLTIPQDPEMIILQLAGQGGDAEEQLNLPHSNLQKQHCRKSFLLKEGCASRMCRVKGIDLQGMVAKFQWSMKEAFSCSGKAGADTFLCAEAGRGGSAVCTDGALAAGLLAVCNHRTVSLTNMPNPYPLFSQASSHCLSSILKYPQQLKCHHSLENVGVNHRQLTKESGVHVENCRFSSEWEADFLH